MRLKSAKTHRTKFSPKQVNLEAKIDRFREIGLSLARRTTDSPKSGRLQTQSNVWLKNQGHLRREDGLICGEWVVFSTKNNRFTQIKTT